ncbi:MAG: hypothetical protein N2645_02525 [Clostridia bacterium]|nr:hypothetical protein [Clostridia bacterium]
MVYTNRDLYLISRNILKRLLSEGILTDMEYQQADSKLQRNYDIISQHLKDNKNGKIIEFRL